MGVYKDLSAGEIEVTRLYGLHTVHFYFSTVPHKLKFQQFSIGDNSMKATEESGLNPLNASKCQQALKLHYKYGVSPYDCALLTDIETYRRIETKGFRIHIDGSEYTCQPNFMLMMKPGV